MAAYGIHSSQLQTSGYGLRCRNQRSCHRYTSQQSQPVIHIISIQLQHNHHHIVPYLKTRLAVPSHIANQILRAINIADQILVTAEKEHTRFFKDLRKELYISRISSMSTFTPIKTYIVCWFIRRSIQM